MESFIDDNINFSNLSLFFDQKNDEILHFGFSVTTSFYFHSIPFMHLEIWQMCKCNNHVLKTTLQFE
ncbi:hypothetical protein DERP_002344 [Dermatophagoides pteronyssinus]|uniref:Uncharacterized protein n=1 Tax=Dermatophagoides pteronyssinus TaxID=6956 RepID=A0ABQ8JHY4_DERPT|nr:hypothetical protein DERP_002344 [Dermatophagoides pteronyssinus]